MLQLLLNWVPDEQCNLFQRLIFEFGVGNKNVVYPTNY